MAEEAVVYTDDAAEFIRIRPEGEGNRGTVLEVVVRGNALDVLLGPEALRGLIGALEERA